jgi:electron transport complex protein RnfD
LGGAWLVARNMMNWRIPVAIFATVAVLSFSFHSLDPERYAGPVFMLLSGGLMLGAVFMATDMVASPITAAGAVAYGVLIGLLVVVIRYWGGMPEGVMYALLLANACSPHISAMFQPRVFGTRARGAR